MGYEHRIQVLPDHIRVEVSGRPRVGFEDAGLLDIAEDVARHLREAGDKPVLGIVSVTGRLSTIAAYHVGYRLADTGISKRVPLAIVQVDPDRLESARFLEITAANNGYQLRVFGNEADALEWLRDTTPGAGGER